MYSEDCDFTSSTPQVYDPPPSSSECSSLRASQTWGEGFPPNTCSIHRIPLPTHTNTHSLSLFLFLPPGGLEPRPEGTFPGLWRLRGWGWGPEPGSGRAGGLSTEGHTGKCRFCMGTQSDPATLCSQTASAMYLGSNKPDGRGHGPLGLLSLSLGSTQPKAWPCRELRPVSFRL